MRRTRSDCTVGTFEKKNGLPAGTIRNRDGRDTRSDKKIGTIRKEAEKRVKERRGAQMVAMPDLEVFAMAEEYYLEAEK